MGTALTYVPALAHTQQFHPENHKRVEDLLRFFEQHGLLSDLQRVHGREAESGLLSAVHTGGLLEEIRQACRSGPGRIDADTYVTPQSYDLARLAAGSCCALVDAIYMGDVQNGLAIVRPPGHHAERNRVGGFCLLNNVAVAARHAQRQHDVERVLIVDLDVHHGNGTQDIFYDDGTILFASLHLFHPFFYPGSGGADEKGSGPGSGLTLNVPFPAGVGDVGYARAIDDLVIPRAREFEPDLILVSAGFDAHWQDPLARASLSLQGYAKICRRLIDLAADSSQGRIIFVLEGGYHRAALHYGLLNLANLLLGRDRIQDPLGPAAEPEFDVTNLLRNLLKLHLPN